ncbi:MAG: alpha/beta fold hydrolase [Oscillospiraceae bacterium]
MKKYIKIIFPILITLFFVAGIIWKAFMTHIEESRYHAIGDYVDTGTYQSHYYSKGSGDTAFVFITGSGTPCAYTDFYVLQNLLSEKGQAVTFDHAGSGWSTDTTALRTIDNMTNELAVLIDTVAPAKPIVIICHSLGSLEAIRYAQTYPEKVKGIIFLDCGSPEFYSTDSELLAKITNRGIDFLRTVGLNRAMGELGLFLPAYGENIRNKNLPESVKKIDKAMFYRFAGNANTLSSISLINENAATVLDGSSLGELPILVLSSDGGDSWNKVQIELASWSNNSEQVLIENSQHYLYWSNYEQVTDCIESFVDKITR